MEIAYFESRIADYNKSHKTDCISVLTPTGYVQDGMVFDSISTNIVNISAYKKDFGDIVLCGIKIVGRNLSPTYFDNDILPGIRLELAPINGDKNSLFIDNIDDVHYFGRVLTVVRDA